MCWNLTKKTLKSCGTIDIHQMSSILLDKIEEMGDNSVDLYLADVSCKIYNKETVKKFLSLDETDKIGYIAEEMDCDDFSAELYGKGVPLIWTNTHAFNWFIDETDTLWFVEPQTDKLSKVLDNWNIRFFLSR